MAKYKVIIEVDEDQLLSYVRTSCEDKTCGESVEKSLEHELGWLRDSGIELEHLEIVKDTNDGSTSNTK